MAEEKLIVQLRGFDAKHYRTTERYAKQVERLYDTAVQEMATAASGLTLGEDETFTFDRYPKAKKQAQGIVTRLAQRIEAVTSQGVKAEWEAACHKNDAFVGSIIRTSKLTKEEAEQYNSRNLEALSTFQQRKVGGLNLSQRVWKYVGDFRDAMELGIDIGLGEGRSAAELSRDLRQYLREPDRLYRRVRDKGGNLRLSKAAKMYHSGQGVYRSSYKNAMRLARTEINMAYREAEYQRWQQLDFVVGFRIHLSNNHTILNSKGEPVPFHDICDELAGDYPKTFKFVGWHPQCRCFVTPILSDYDEYNKNRANRLKAIVRKQQYKALPSRRTVTDVPPTFRKYIEGIEERAKGWKSQPYYIRDNFKGGVIGGGLNGRIPTKTMNTVQPCTEFDGLISSLKRWAYAFGLNVSTLDALRNAGDRNALKLEVDRINAIAQERQEEWLGVRAELSAAIHKINSEGFSELENEYRNILKETECTPSNYFAGCISKIKQAISKALADLKAAIANRKPSTLDDINRELGKTKISYNDVAVFSSPKDETEIIQRLGGGDKTGGSCSSLAFAYAGNKGGLDVLDFRGGESRSYFSSSHNIMRIAKQVGGVVVEGKNDFTNASKLLASVAEGKEYYFTCGRHAAIIRKTSTGIEYLELQSNSANGFKPLTKDVLKYRFGAKQSHSVAGIRYEVKECLIDIELLRGDGFRKMMGYINTAGTAQNKGATGSIK